MATPEIEQCLAAYAAGIKPERETERTAVKAILSSLTAKAPGHAVELRIPPFSAVQLIEGPRHRRGTPGAVVETSASVLVRLASNELTWAQAVATGVLIASGERSDLSHLFPIDSSL